MGGSALSVAAGLLCLLVAPGPAVGQSADRTVLVVRSDSLTWTGGTRSGVEFTMLTGDPRTDGPFTFRMRMPASWAMRPHEHDAVEHITVLTGTLEMRFGPHESRVRLPPGSFVSIPEGTPMWAWTGDEPVVIQVHGTGPFATASVETDQLRDE
jgi:quercetin dioxygenase-like cupin family protein